MISLNFLVFIGHIDPILSITGEADGSGPRWLTDITNGYNIALWLCPECDGGVWGLKDRYLVRPHAFIFGCCRNKSGKKHDFKMVKNQIRDAFMKL